MVGDEHQGSAAVPPAAHWPGLEQLRAATGCNGEEQVPGPSSATYQLSGPGQVNFSDAWLPSSTKWEC